MAPFATHSSSPRARSCAPNVPMPGRIDVAGRQVGGKRSCAARSIGQLQLPGRCREDRDRLVDLAASGSSENQTARLVGR